MAKSSKLSKAEEEILARVQKGTLNRHLVGLGISPEDFPKIGPRHADRFVKRLAEAGLIEWVPYTDRYGAGWALPGGIPNRPEPPPNTRRVLQIVIEAGPKTCASKPGKFCPQVRTQRFGGTFSCGVFNKGLRDDDGWLMRLPDCIDAEKDSLLGVAPTEPPPPKLSAMHLAPGKYLLFTKKVEDRTKAVRLMKLVRERCGVVLREASQMVDALPGNLYLPESWDGGLSKELRDEGFEFQEIELT